MIGLVALALAGGGVVDAERAFAAMAQRDGQWTAFRAYAAPDAVMFVPGKANAQDWLKGRADPQQSVKWWPGRVVVSCDNTLALSTGAWRRPDGSTGVFTTIWRRDGDGWHWILDHGHDTPKPVATPEPAAIVLQASCKGLSATRRPHRLEADLAALVKDGSIGGASQDRSLGWSFAGSPPDSPGQLAVSRWTGHRYQLTATEPTP